MKRSFAYLGVPPLFIGEIVLGAFLLLKPRVALGTWAASLLRPSPLNGLGLALLVFVALRRLAGRARRARWLPC